MAEINLGGVQFPVIYCTVDQYNRLAEKEAGVVYIITNAEGEDPTIYLNEIAIANNGSGREAGTVRSVSNVVADSSGNVPLTANNVDTYNKAEIEQVYSHIISIVGIKYNVSE